MKYLVSVIVESEETSRVTVGESVRTVLLAHNMLCNILNVEKEKTGVGK